MKTNGNTILVTGGGSGIGEALAHRWHDQGNTVIIAGRRQDALDAAIAGRANMHAMVFDVADSGAIPAFVERLIAAHPTLNVLVNNAGIMRYETIEARRDMGDAEAEVAINLLAPIRLIDALVDHLKDQADAAIINVSSGLAFVPLVASPTYSATKAAIHTYTVCLREALKGSVEVIELVPPAVRTTLTPGQESIEAFLPLDAFIDETMDILSQQPTPSEIVVERARFQRDAEAEHRFADTLAQLNAH